MCPVCGLLVHVYLATQCHNPQGHNKRPNNTESIKSYTTQMFSWKIDSNQNKNLSEEVNFTEDKSLIRK